MSKIILGLVGPLASGKEATKEYILKKYKAQDCKFSTALRDVLDRVSVPNSRENLQRLSTILREEYGEDLLAKSIASDASHLNADIVVIDGVRRLSDIQYLNKLSHFILVKIDADPKKRYKRLVLRNENKGDDKKTFEQFLKDHESEADSLVPVVMRQAQKSIDNNGSFEDLYEQIDKLIKELT